MQTKFSNTLRGLRAIAKLGWLHSKYKNSSTYTIKEADYSTHRDFRTEASTDQETGFSFSPFLLSTVSEFLTSAVTERNKGDSNRRGKSQIAS